MRDAAVVARVDVPACRKEVVEPTDWILVQGGNESNSIAEQSTRYHILQPLAGVLKGWSLLPNVGEAYANMVDRHMVRTRTSSTQSP